MTRLRTWKNRRVSENSFILRLLDEVAL